MGDAAATDDRWRAITKHATLAAFKPRPFHCCAECSDGGRHIASHLSHPQPLLQEEEGWALGTCPKCCRAMPPQRVAQHFRACGPPGLANSAGDVVWVKFSSGWHPGVLGIPTPAQRQAGRYPVTFVGEAVPWEVKAARHEYRVAAPCRRYCDAVGLLTRGTRIEVELCARSGPCWKVAEIVDHHEGAVYLAHFTNRPATARAGPRPPADHSDDIFASETIVAGAGGGPLPPAGPPLPGVNGDGDGDVDAAGNDRCNARRAPRCVVEATLQRLRRVQAALGGRKRRREAAADEPHPADCDDIVEVDLGVLPFRVLEFPRQQRAAGPHEGWFSFLYWDMREMGWRDVRRYRLRVPVSVSLRTIHDPKHPVCGGIGAFASAVIPKGTCICYGGFLTVASENSTSAYIAGLADSGLDCDAQMAGSEGRFMNDHRGTGCPFNVQFQKHVDIVTGEISFVGQVLRDIVPGEELLTSYGSASYWKCLQPPPAATASPVPLGARLKVKYVERTGAAWYVGTVTAILPSKEFVVAFDVGGEEAVSSIAQYEVLPAPASRPTAWPGHLEHVSGYRWDPQLRFRHFYGANRCAALRVPAKVVPGPGGALGLFSHKPLTAGTLVGPYSGRVTVTCPSPDALPLPGGDEFFVVNCGNECRYMRHCFHTGNVHAELRHSAVNGHPFVALVTTQAVPAAGELVLDRSKEWQTSPACHRRLCLAFPDVVPDNSSLL